MIRKLFQFFVLFFSFSMIANPYESRFPFSMVEKPYKLHVHQDYICSKIHKGADELVRDYFKQERNLNSFIVSLNQLLASFFNTEIFRKLLIDNFSKYHIYLKYGYVIIIPKNYSEHGLDIKKIEKLSIETLSKLLDDYENGYVKEGICSGISPKNWTKEELKEFFGLEVSALTNYYYLTCLLDEIIPKENYGQYEIELTRLNYENSIMQPFLYSVIDRKIHSSLKSYGACELGIYKDRFHTRPSSLRLQFETLLICGGMFYGTYKTMKYGVNFLCN